MGSVICKVSATQLGDKTVGRIVGLKTLGDEEIVKRQFEGLVKCMRDGTEADGMARQIGGWVTVYPVFVGPIDLSRGFDPEKNGVRIRMRLLNEIDVDITDWEFRDVTPGRTPFTLDSASTGELVNTVKVGDPIHVNGRPFPSHDALRVDWAVEGTDKSGTIPAEKFTSDATLITIAADALAELASDEYDGKTIVFTVRGNFASAKISATLKYVAPAFTLVAPEKVPFNGDGWDLHGTNLGGFDKEAQSIVVRFDCKEEVGGGRGETYWDAESVEDGVIHVEGMVDAAAKNGGDCEIVVTIGDETHSVHSVVSDAPDIPPEP